MVRTQEIVERIIQVALENGVLSPDEINIIRSVLENVDEYLKLLKRASEDNIITVGEKKELIKKRKVILDDAYDTANEDLLVTQEEFNLLQETLELIYRLELDQENKYQQFMNE